MAFQREVAHRLFASEFNASRHTIQGQGEKDPSFVVSPLGAKINRLHIVGVCTDVEAVGDSGEVWRARISDPTGVFTIYAGQYQPEAANALSSMEPPQYVAVTGKGRTYEPEPGSVFVSVRPESINVVDEGTRDEWVLHTAERTMHRLEAAQAVRDDPQTTQEALVARKIRPMDAEGALLAQEAYGLTDIRRYGEGVREALGYLRDGEVPIRRIEAREDSGPVTQTAVEAPAYTPVAPVPAADDGAEDAMDEGIMAHVQRLEGDAGAQWDDVLKEAAVDGTTAEDVEEALNRLMDKGLVYEPTLGVLKTT